MFLELKSISIPMSGAVQREMQRVGGTAHYGQELDFLGLVLELLTACGMIFGARLRSSQAVGRCHRPLSSSVHYSSVIFVNDLNLSGGSCV